jgi:hypothetical protein
MKMIDEKFTDINGREYRLHTVRSMGANRGFGCIDRRLNAFATTGFSTRKEAWDYVNGFCKRHGGGAVKPQVCPVHGERWGRRSSFGWLSCAERREEAVNAIRQ